MRLEAHLDKKGILLKVLGVPYERADDLRKQVSGSRYVGALSDRGYPRWVFRYPTSVDKCVEMREAWGDMLKVHSTLGDWYRSAARQRQAQVVRTTQTDAKLTIVDYAYPELGKYLHGDQRVTAAWVANLYRGGGLLGDEVGTGKTVGVVAGLIEAATLGPTLIVCPKISVKAVWGKEFREHCPDVPVYLARGKRKFREAAIAGFLADTRPFKVLVIVAEMLRVKVTKAQGRITEFFGYDYPGLFEVDWSAVIVDESHRLLGSLDVVKGNLAGEGLKALNYAPNRIKLAVSATPFGKGGRVDALFGSLHWLWPDEFSSKWAWLRKYFEVTEQKVFVKNGGGATQTVRRIGEVNDEDRLWRDLGPRVLRRTMEEVSPAHRGLKNWVEVLCEMDTRQRVQYTKFAQDAELAVDGGIISTVGPLDFMTRCRQFANGFLRKEGGRVVYVGESCKIDRLLAHLDGLEPGRKVVITSQYNEYLDVVEKRLHEEGYWDEWEGNAATHKAGAMLRMDGKTSEGKRDAYMHLFQTDPRYTVFLLNSQAGGVSITLDAAEEMHQLDEMYPPEANTQLYGRIFRRGRVHQVFFYLYRSIGTIDEQIGYKVGEGAAKQLRVLDGRRGLEYVRTLAQYEEE